jgi:hypothetical protein
MAQLSPAGLWPTHAHWRSFPLYTFHMRKHNWVKLPLPPNSRPKDSSRPKSFLFPFLAQIAQFGLLPRWATFSAPSPTWPTRPIRHSNCWCPRQGLRHCTRPPRSIAVRNCTLERLTRPTLAKALSIPPIALRWTEEATDPWVVDLVHDVSRSKIILL